ncbi:MAG: hypothetical protein H6726_19085 [Sandaracinaceae bacterium]|nr:hypothetical protein [Sandaracinaceae bacterium]
MRYTVVCQVIVSVFALLSGCSANYFSLRTSFAMDNDDARHPRVVVSPTGAEYIAQVRTVAIRPDARCRDYLAGEGQSDTEAQLMHLRCGVPMAALESAFAQEGYRVIYWSAIERRAEQRRPRPEVTCTAEGACPNTYTPNGGDILEVTAAEMGVDVLITVNSLEWGTSTVASQANWTRTYHRATRSGVELGDYLARPGVADAMDSFLRAQEDGISRAAMPSVSVDITAHYLDADQHDHESFFFYRETRTLNSSDWSERRYFVSCGSHKVGRLFHRRVVWSCSTATPRPSNEDTRPPRSGSEDSVALDTGDMQNRTFVWRTLTGNIMDDVARSFRNGGVTPGAARGMPVVAPAATPTAPAAPAADADAPEWMR